MRGLGVERESDRARLPGREPERTFGVVEDDLAGAIRTGGGELVVRGSVKSIGSISTNPTSGTSGSRHSTGHSSGSQSHGSPVLLPALLDVSVPTGLTGPSRPHG